MPKDLFSTTDKLKEVHNILMHHLTTNSYVIIKDKVQIHLPENGDVSFWFTDLINVILLKVQEKDPEIVKLCMESGIDLFDIQVKK